MLLDTDATLEVLIIFIILKIQVSRILKTKLIVSGSYITELF